MLAERRNVFINKIDGINTEMAELESLILLIQRRLAEQAEKQSIEKDAPKEAAEGP